MRLRKKSLKNARLYLILDTEVGSYGKLFDTAVLAIRGGVDVIQLRDKNGTAKSVLEFSRRLQKIIRGKIPYIINDRVDLALAAHADGVHLGQDDLAVAFARKSLGKSALIGKSCQSLGHVRGAMKEDVDYLGFGSVFKTLTKPEREPMDLNVLRRVVKASTVPLFAIGGIVENNLAALIRIGVRKVAVCRAIINARDPLLATRALKNILISKIG
jgi:thiamine-phosphate pyrophosphorylase